MKFDSDYYETLLDGIEDRVRTRSRDMAVPDAIFRTFVDDRLLAEFSDPQVTDAIRRESYHAADPAIAQSFANWLAELEFDGPDQAQAAGDAFHRVFRDVSQRLDDSPAS